MAAGYGAARTSTEPVEARASIRRVEDESTGTLTSLLPTLVELCTA
jgi:hypothetical protein